MFKLFHNRHKIDMHHFTCNRLKVVSLHVNGLPTSIWSFELRLLPIHVSLVLSVFISNPDIEPKVSKTLRAAKRDSLLRFKIRIVSSSYLEILYPTFHR